MPAAAAPPLAEPPRCSASPPLASSRFSSSQGSAASSLGATPKAAGGMPARAPSPPEVSNLLATARFTRARSRLQVGLGPDLQSAPVFFRVRCACLLAETFVAAVDATPYLSDGRLNCGQLAQAALDAIGVELRYTAAALFFASDGVYRMARHDTPVLDSLLPWDSLLLLPIGQAPPSLVPREL